MIARPILLFAIILALAHAVVCRDNILIPALEVANSLPVSNGSLVARASYVCPSGDALCPGTSFCCPIGQACRPGGYCCPAGDAPCPNSPGCCPKGVTCFADHTCDISCTGFTPCGVGCCNLGYTCDPVKVICIKSSSYTPTYPKFTTSNDYTSEDYTSTLDYTSTKLLTYSSPTTTFGTTSPTINSQQYSPTPLSSTAGFYNPSPASFSNSTNTTSARPGINSSNAFVAPLAAIVSTTMFLALLMML